MAIDSAKARERIENAEDLPTLPTVARQIVATANSPRTSATDVGALINRDQALTGKVLKLVNSAFYGFPQQIKTINHAIVILGFNKVKNVVLTASVFDLAAEGTRHHLDVRRFWEHALGTAIAAQVVATQIGRGVAPDDAFVGGLLHDFGKVILDQFLPEEYGPVLDYARTDKTLLRAAEKEVLGFDHQQVGTWLAEKWKLPAELVTAIRYHNLPSSARDEREMAASVHVGDIVCRALGVGYPGDDSIPELNANVVELYKIDKAFLGRAVEGTADELKRAGDFFELIEG
jgi:putative nucleotidyltransferase with HDIG domain